MKIKLVKQEDDCGCVIACMAMVLGETYESIKKDFRHDFTEEGTSTPQMCEYLGDKGCTIIAKGVSCYVTKDDVRQEMLEPFAPLHILHIQFKFDSRYTHVVVMLEDGTILCPGGFSDEEIREAYMIKEIYGIYK